MSITKGELAQRSLRLIGVNTRFSEASAVELQDTLNYLEDWLLAQNALGKRLGYIVSGGIPNPADESGVPDWSVMGITNSLALYIAPYYDKPIHPAIAMNAAVGMRTISQQTIEIQEVCYPNRMPIGTGSKWFVYGPHFYPQPDPIITNNDFLKDEGGDVITTGSSS